MPYVNIQRRDGEVINLHYRRAGGSDRPPVVLLHGWASGLEMWEPQFEALVAAGHQVIAYDQRGCGGSSQQWHGHELASQADDLDALLRALELDQVALVGYSLGASIVASLAARHGVERVRRAVLISTTTPQLSEDAPLGELRARLDANLLQAIAWCQQRAFGEYRERLGPQGWAYLDAIARRCMPRALRERARHWCEAELHRALGHLTRPTLLIHGEADELAPLVGCAEASLEKLPEARLEVIARAPHALTVTHPRRVNRLLLEFLSG